MKILLNALPQRELVCNHMNNMAPKILHVKDENFLGKCGVERGRLVSLECLKKY